MLPVFPLGVKKDAPPSGWAKAFRTPSFDAERALAAIGADAEAAPRFSTGFPSAAFGDDVGIKVAGAGGDGAQTAAMLLAKTAINEGFDATHIPSYGPESRGGTSFADVRLAAKEVLSPVVAEPHVLVAFNAPSLARFGPAVRRGGVVVYDRSVDPRRAGSRPGGAGRGGPLHRDRARARAAAREERRRARRARRRDRAPPGRGAPLRAPPGARGQARRGGRSTRRRSGAASRRPARADRPPRAARRVSAAARSPPRAASTRRATGSARRGTVATPRARPTPRRSARSRARGTARRSRAPGRRRSRW